MSFKEGGDVELARCFLYPFILWIKARFLGYVFVPVPSSQSRIEKRGFSHLNLILEAYGLPVADVLVKDSDEEQKKTGAVERHSSKGIRCIDPSKISKKKIVVFDDVMTTGASFHESVQALETAGAGHIEGVILMDNFREEELKIG